MVQPALSFFSTQDRALFARKKIDIDSILQGVQRKAEVRIVKLLTREEQSNVEEEALQSTLFRAMNLARGLVRQNKNQEQILRAVTAPAILDKWVRETTTFHRRNYRMMKRNIPRMRDWEKTSSRMVKRPRTLVRPPVFLARKTIIHPRAEPQLLPEIGKLLNALSPRQQKIVRGLVRGKTKDVIAKELEISPSMLSIELQHVQKRVDPIIRDRSPLRRPPRKTPR